jgi:uncharacterized protein (DUF1499 family)
MGAFGTFVMVVVGLAVLVFIVGRAGLLKGKPPQLGVRDGRLKPPARTPNSVTSQAALYPDAPQRDYAAIDPLPLRGDGTASLEKIRTVVATMPGATVVDTRPDYLYAQFMTPTLRFVDDTEFWFSPGERLIHVRSSSRIGRRDFGVNRKRVESIRDAYMRS